MANPVVQDDAACFAAAKDFFERYAAATVRQRARVIAHAPLVGIQTAALRHPDPFVRRWCLFFLDHYANDVSMSVFAAALHDPVDFVRNIALHSLACEACKSEELCVADVVPGLIQVLAQDRSPDLRAKAIPLLLRLSAGDSRARRAVEAAATSDPDPLVRQAALDALAGRFVLPRKRYERSTRRHAKQRARRE